MKTASEAHAQIKRDQTVAKSFRRTFMKERKVMAHAGEVLARIREFCNADTSTMQEGRSESTIFMHEGRRQVWLMINFYLNLDDRELTRLDSEYQRAIASALEEHRNGSSSTS